MGCSCVKEMEEDYIRRNCIIAPGIIQHNGPLSTLDSYSHAMSRHPTPFEYTSHIPSSFPLLLRTTSPSAFHVASATVASSAVHGSHTPTAARDTPPQPQRTPLVKAPMSEYERRRAARERREKRAILRTQALVETLALNSKGASLVSSGISRRKSSQSTSKNSLASSGAGSAATRTNFVKPTAFQKIVEERGQLLLPADLRGSVSSKTQSSSIITGTMTPSTDCTYSELPSSSMTASSTTRDDYSSSDEDVLWKGLKRSCNGWQKKFFADEQLDDQLEKLNNLADILLDDDGGSGSSSSGPFGGSDSESDPWDMSDISLTEEEEQDEDDGSGSGGDGKKRGKGEDYGILDDSDD